MARPVCQSTTIRSVVAARVTGRPVKITSSTPAIAALRTQFLFRCCRAAVIVLAKDGMIRIELAPNVKRGRNREVCGAGEQPVNWGDPMNFALRFAAIAALVVGLG